MTNDSLRGRPLDAADPSPRRVIAAVVVQALDKSQGHADADARSLADLTIDDLRAAPTAPADPEAQLASYVVEVLTPDLPAVLTALSAKAREGSATHQRLYLQLLGIVPMGSTYRPPTAPTNGADPDAEG